MLGFLEALSEWVLCASVVVVPWILYGVRKDREFWRTRRRTIAVVEERVFKPGVSRPSAVVVTFTTEDGRTHTGNVLVGTNGPMIQVGDPLDVYYSFTSFLWMKTASSQERVRAPRRCAELLVLAVPATAAVLWYVLDRFQSA